MQQIPVSNQGPFVLEGGQHNINNQRQLSEEKPSNNDPVVIARNTDIIDTSIVNPEGPIEPMLPEAVMDMD